LWLEKTTRIIRSRVPLQYYPNMYYIMHFELELL